MPQVSLAPSTPAAPLHSTAIARVRGVQMRHEPLKGVFVLFDVQGEQFVELAGEAGYQLRVRGGGAVAYGRVVVRNSSGMSCENQPPRN
ncbi:hypothetical protein [Streptomyces sp. NBC_01435]|uniref:hypothetical protein n=1 Tax=Streptomyces sp. NBC_01435 TaxID=2903865 RepID=UPI003FCDC30D